MASDERFRFDLTMKPVDAFSMFCDECLAETIEVGAGDSYSFTAWGPMFWTSRQKCPKCGSVIRQLFFNIFFIPMIPLGRYRFAYTSSGTYVSRRIDTQYRYSDAPAMLEFAARLEDVDVASAIMRYQHIADLFPGTREGVEAARNVEHLKPNKR